MKKLTPEEQEALRAIKQTSGGILRAEDVVNTAANPEHILHDRFEWNDGEAAHQYRLDQARGLIRIAVVVVKGPPPKHEEIVVREYESTSSRRIERGGGYEFTVDIMKDPNRRAELLDTALAELKNFEARYRHLDLLAGIFVELDKLRDNIKKRKR